jgi:hypothetical protein
VNVTGRPKGLEVTGGGRGIASHAGLGLLRRLADATGLTPGADVQIKSPPQHKCRCRVNTATALGVSGGVRLGLRLSDS